MDDISSFRRQILQSEPVFPDEYLSEVLHLPADSKIISKNILEDRTTDTTRTIKLLITWKATGEEEHNGKFFFKLPIPGKHEMHLTSGVCMKLIFTSMPKVIRSFLLLNVMMHMSLMISDTFY